MGRHLIFIALLCMLASGVTRATYYVDGSVPSSGNGTSWGSAFKTIQEGVNAAHSVPGGDEVWVKAGTYAYVEVGESVVTDSFLDMPGNQHAVDILGQENEMPYLSSSQYILTAHLTVLYLTGSLTAQPPNLDFSTSNQGDDFKTRLERLLARQTLHGRPILVFANHPSVGNPFQQGSQFITQEDLRDASRVGALHAMELTSYLGGSPDDAQKWDFALANMADSGSGPQRADKTLWALRGDDSHSATFVNYWNSGLTMGCIADANSCPDRIRAFQDMIRRGTFAILPPHYKCGMPTYTLASDGNGAASLRVQVQGISDAAGVEMRFIGCAPGGG